MTCNPELKEITNELKKCQLAQDRPDLTSRIFRAKLQDLKDQLFKNEIFGKVVAHIHVIKFQKRGLPHVHIIIILQERYKILFKDQFDIYVSVELSNKEPYPDLNELVVKNMIYGPCGKYRSSKSCIINDKCKFHYPRAFCSQTLQGKDGYPIYRRRANGFSMKIKKKIIDNR